MIKDVIKKFSCLCGSVHFRVLDTRLKSSDVIQYQVLCLGCQSMHVINLDLKHVIEKLLNCERNGF